MEEALELSRSLDDEFFVGACMEGLGDVKLDLRRNEEAWSLYLEAENGQRTRRTADARRHDRWTRSRCGAARGSRPCHDDSGRRSNSGSRSEEPFSREPADAIRRRTRRRDRCGDDGLCRRSLSKRRSTPHESASPRSA